jgi:hypothetical protein
MPKLAHRDSDFALAILPSREVDCVEGRPSDVSFERCERHLVEHR